MIQVTLLHTQFKGLIEVVIGHHFGYRFLSASDCFLELFSTLRIRIPRTIPTGNFSLSLIVWHWHHLRQHVVSLYQTEIVWNIFWKKMPQMLSVSPESHMLSYWQATYLIHLYLDWKEALITTIRFLYCQISYIQDTMVSGRQPIYLLQLMMQINTHLSLSPQYNKIK